MCGIVGVMTTAPMKYGSPYNKFFKQALFADTLRGVDSTGVAVLAPDMEQPEVYKKALAAPDFIQLKKADQLLDTLNGWNVMLGHNRAATRGGVHHATAHPFQIGTITLIHNGTVTNHRTLPEGNNYVVDSEAICNAVAKVGIRKVVSTLSGAFTLVWHDSSDGSINIIRNDERPLWIGLNKAEDAIVLASESHMLKWLASRNNIELSKVFQPAVGAHYKYIVGGSETWATTPKVEMLPLYVAPVYQGGYRYGKKDTAPTTGTPTKGNGNVVDFPVKLSEIAVSILKTLGEDRSDEVIFTPEKYQPYPHNQNSDPMGLVEGVLLDCKIQHTVRMYSVSPKDWKEMQDRFVLAKVNSAYKSGAVGYLLTVVNKDYQVFDIDGVSADEKPLELPDYSYVKGPRGAMISDKAFEGFTQYGCDMCQGNIYIEDHDKTQWTRDNMPICKECSELNGWDY